MRWSPRPALLASLLASLLSAATPVVADPVPPAPQETDSAPAIASALPATGGRVLVLLRLPPPHLRVGGDYGGSYGDGVGRAARHRIAAALARSNGLALVDDWPMPLLGVDCYVMTVPVGRSLAAVASMLSGMPGVAWSQPVAAFGTRGSARPVRPVARPDPLFDAQPAAVRWHLADLHRIADGRGIKVAIVDSTVDRSHPDLAGQVPVSADFTLGEPPGPEQHGTGVAGIIAARADNGIGIAGIAPRARLMALRACWQQAAAAGGSTVCDTFSLAKAIYFAVERGAGVLNLSLGGPRDALLARLLDLALARGITVVAAFDRASRDGGFPASHPGVVAVADDAPGLLPAGVFTAPGHGIPTTGPGAGWRLVNGSSYAAAHVSGLFALMHSREAGASAGPALVTTGAASIDSCASLLGAAGDRRYRCPTKIALAPRN